MTKTNLGRKGFMWLTGWSPSLREALTGTQDRKLEAGIESESTKEYYLLPLAYSASLLIYLRSTCLRMILPTAGWAPCHK